MWNVMRSFVSFGMRCEPVYHTFLQPRFRWLLAIGQGEKSFSSLQLEAPPAQPSWLDSNRFTWEELLPPVDRLLVFKIFIHLILDGVLFSLLLQNRYYVCCSSLGTLLFVSSKPERLISQWDCCVILSYAVVIFRESIHVVVSWVGWRGSRVE